MDRNEMSNFYKEPSIDASYQVSVYLADGFRRRRLKCEKLTDDRRRTSSDDNSSHCLWQGELKKTYKHNNNNNEKLRPDRLWPDCLGVGTTRNHFLVSCGE